MKVLSLFMERCLKLISHEALLLALLTISIVVALGLSAFVLNAASSSNQAFASNIEMRVLQVLESDGLSGLVAELELSPRRLMPEPNEVGFVVRRQSGDTSRVLVETKPGLAEATIDADPDETLEFHLNNVVFHAFTPDITTLSRDWDFQFSDVLVSFAIAQPTAASRTASRQLSAVWTGVGLAVGVGLLLHLDHRRRYRVGLDQINQVLDAFASGKTSPDVSFDPAAPELRRLSQHLSNVLPRFDRLITDLRALTAHLAHEMNTPLQVIRADMRRLVSAENEAERRSIAMEIDETIDSTDARLGSVMRLFRLSADDEVAPEHGVKLGALVDDLIDTYWDFLVAEDRKLILDIDHGIEVTANPPLLELVLSNLLSNAGKFAPPGATIGTELKRHKDHFQLTVWNSGSTFPEEWQKRGFQRLSRAKLHRDMAGFGLGLALVDIIARWHGFRVQARNEEHFKHGLMVAAVTLEGECGPGS
ncbi:MAG: HAMP domain-containing sensor histidine kinase [Pseudomonadota bacterium]